MEIWKKLEGFKYEYEVSNYGRIRYPEHGGFKMHETYGSMSTRRNGQNYMKVLLVDSEGRSRTYKVHRLVAGAFLENNGINPDGSVMTTSACVNHKNENPLVNNVENLEWCDYRYNNTYGDRIKNSINTKNRLKKNK